MVISTDHHHIAVEVGLEPPRDGSLPPLLSANASTVLVALAHQTWLDARPKHCRDTTPPFIMSKATTSGFVTVYGSLMYGSKGVCMVVSSQEVTLYTEYRYWVDSFKPERGVFHAVCWRLALCLALCVTPPLYCSPVLC